MTGRFGEDWRWPLSTFLPGNKSLHVLFLAYNPDDFDGTKTSGCGPILRPRYQNPQAEKKGLNLKTRNQKIVEKNSGVDRSLIWSFPTKWKVKPQPLLQERGSTLGFHFFIFPDVRPLVWYGVHTFLENNISSSFLTDLHNFPFGKYKIGPFCFLWRGNLARWRIIHTPPQQLHPGNWT